MLRSLFVSAPSYPDLSLVADTPRCASMVSFWNLDLYCRDTILILRRYRNVMSKLGSIQGLLGARRVWWPTHSVKAHGSVGGGGGSAARARSPPKTLYERW